MFKFYFNNFSIRRLVFQQSRNIEIVHSCRYYSILTFLISEHRPSKLRRDIDITIIAADQWLDVLLEIA